MFGNRDSYISLILAPAEKHLETPVIIITETQLSFSSSKRYLFKSEMIYDLKAFRVFGEFIVIMAIR